MIIIAASIILKRMGMGGFRRNDIIRGRFA